VSAQLQTVHVRVNDAATGQPTAAYLRLTDLEGRYYAPFGRLSTFPTGIGVDVGGGNVMVCDEAFAVIDGTCEVRLPVGPVRLEAFKGGPYRPVSRELVLGAGKMALRVDLERWADPSRDGWYAGDTLAFFLSPHAALLEAAAQDLHVVNLLASAFSGPALLNLLAFSGQQPALEASGRLVVVNTFNRHFVLGALALLNCHRVVYPLTFGGDQGPDDWTLADWCDQCHRKGGLVVAADFFSSRRWERGEVIADLLLGKVDALDWVGAWVAGEKATSELLPAWYQLLNCGVRVPLVAGSSKDCNGELLGRPRTYARLLPGQEFSYPAWVEAVRGGRTYVTADVLLTFTVNGQDPGSLVSLPAENPLAHVRLEACGLRPFGKLEIIANGKVVAEKPFAVRREDEAASPISTILETDVPMENGGWLAARCGLRPAAHTSPIYVRTEGRSPPRDPDALAFVAQHLEDMGRWVETEGRFENDKQKQRLAGIFQSAKEVLAVALRAPRPL
jgi:hypothetical protein